MPFIPHTEEDTREMLDAQQARYRQSFDSFFQRTVAVSVVRAGLGILMRQAL